VDVGRPYRAVCSRIEGEILIVLAGTNRPLTGREVARLTKQGSQAGVNRALRRLVEHGIVGAQEAGAAILYTLNRDHLASPIVLLLSGLREELLRRLRDSLDAWKIAPYHVSLFGSTARADGDTSSDIDIFLVRPAKIDEDNPVWRGRVDLWVQDVYRWTGNHVGLAEIAQKELGRLRRTRPEIVPSLLSDAILLKGPPVAELLRRRR